jgi:hypothetical protein
MNGKRMNELRLDMVTFTYIDSSGSFANLPKIGDSFKTSIGEFKIMESLPQANYSDNGKKPFYVRLTCKPQTIEYYNVIKSMECLHLND